MGFENGHTDARLRHESPFIFYCCSGCGKIFDVSYLTKDFDAYFCSICLNTRREISLTRELNSINNLCHREDSIHSLVSPRITRRCDGCNKIYNKHLLADEFGKCFCTDCLRSRREINRSRLQQRIAVLNSTPKQSANIEETVKHFQMVIEAALLKAEFGIEGLEKLLKVHQTPAQRNCIELFTRLPPKGSINASKSTYIKPPSNQNYLRNSTSRNDIHDALSWNSQSTLKEPFQPRPIKGIIKEDRSTETSTNPDSTLLFKIPSATASQITVKVGKCVAFSAERLRSTKSYPADKDLQKHFDRFGFVEEVYRSRRPSNGFIVFESSDAAKAALSELNHEVSGCRLTLKQTKPEFKLPKKKAQPSIQFEEYPVNLVAVCSCIRFQTLVRQSKCAQPTNFAIKKHFRKIGKLVAFYKEEDDPNGFVVYTNVATAQKALSKKNHVVEGCELKLIPSSRDLSKDERYIDFLESDVVRCKRLVFQALTAQCNVPCPSEEALRSYFATFGKIVDFYKHPIHPNGDMVFKKLSDATSAFFTPNHVVQGCTIKLVATSHYV